MDHGSELKYSKPPHSSSSLGSSSDGFFQLDLKATATSFSFDTPWNDSNDTNGNYSKLGKFLNAPASSALKVSDVTDESMLQNWSPMQFPPIQLMEKPGDLDSYRISSSVLASDPSTPDSFSFEPRSHSKDTNGTHSKLEGVLNASMSSASKTSDVTYESALQNMSPTHSPTIQVMEKPGGYDTNGIPSSIFMSKSSTPTEWSNASNESLFSIQIGNHSFSRDAILKMGGDSYKSGELETHGELVKYRHMSLAPKGGENNTEAPNKGLGAGNSPRTTDIPIEPVKNRVDNQHMVPLGAGANAPHHYVGRNPNKFVDLPITKKSEPTGCQCHCAGCTREYCYCSRPSHCIICSGCSCARLSCRGCSCKWFSRLSFSCKCLRCWCKQPKCQGCCGGLSCFSCYCCKQPKCCGCCWEWPCLNCYCCNQPKRCGSCCDLPCLNCYCCESITCSCFYFKCSIWRSCLCRCLFCCGWNCCQKNSNSSVAKDRGRITRAAA